MDFWKGTSCGLALKWTEAVEWLTKCTLVEPMFMEAHYWIAFYELRHLNNPSKAIEPFSFCIDRGFKVIFIIFVLFFRF